MISRPVSAAVTPGEKRQQDEFALWYAVFTHPHSEEVAARHLAYQGFNTYLPFRLRTVRHARRLLTKRSAYFSRYLFVSLDVRRQRWRAVNSTFGVTSLVTSEGMPLPVAPHVVETLISATDKSGLLQPGTLAPGQNIRMTAGAFNGQLGVLDQVDEKGAVRVLLEIMSRQVPVRVSRDQFVVLR
jgi:transcription elongation factor/antiterminator RfaH